MADQWFYRMFGEEFGPMPLEKLKELADAGTIQALDYVRCSPSLEWVAAATVDELELSASERRSGPQPKASLTDREISTAAVSDAWFCQIHGRQLGPLSFDLLIDYAKNRQLCADDQVKLGVQGKWRRAGSIGRLMAALPYQAVETTIIPGASKPLASVPADANRVKSTDVPVTAGRPSNRRSNPAIPTPPTASKSNPTVVIPQARRTSDPQVEPTQDVLDQPTATRPKPGSLPEIPVIREPQAEPIRASIESSSSRAFSAHAARPAPVPFKPPVRRKATSNGSTWLSDLFEKLQDPKTLGSLGAIAVVTLFFGWGFLPKSRAADIKRYQALKSLVDEIRAKRTSSPTDLPHLQQELEKTAKEIAAEVKGKASRDEPAKQCLLWATRDEIPRFLQAGLATESPAEMLLVSRLQDTAYELGLEKRPVVAPAPLSAESDD